MSALGAEQREILASFAEEIRPVLADVASALQHLAEQPGDTRVAGAALSDVRTAQAVISFLDLASFHAVLGSVAEGIEMLGSASVLSVAQRDHAWQLADLLTLHAPTIADGDTSGDVLARAQGLVAELSPSGLVEISDQDDQRGNGNAALDLDSLLDTLGPILLNPAAGDPTPAPSQAVEIDIHDLLATLSPTPADIRSLTPMVSNGVANASDIDGLNSDAPDVADADTIPFDFDALLVDSAPDSPLFTVVSADEPTGEVSRAEITNDGANLEGADGRPAANPLQADAELLLVSLSLAREEIATRRIDESTLLDLSWSARSARGTAGRAGKPGLADLYDLIARFADRAGSEAPFSDMAAAAFVATAEEVIQLVIGDPSSLDPAADLVALLELQLGGLDGDDTGSSAGQSTWGDLPDDVLAELEGVEIDDLDDATLERLAAMLDAHDALHTSTSSESDPEHFDIGPNGRSEPTWQDAQEITGTLDDLPATIAEPPHALAEPSNPTLARTDTAPDSPSRFDLALDAFPSDWALLDGQASISLLATPPGAGDDATFEAEIRAIFLAEAEEHLTAINEAILRLDEQPEDLSPLAEIRRAVHTLKGAAAAVEMVTVSHFCHAWEDALESGAESPSQSLLMECAEALERYLANPNDALIIADFTDLAARLGSGAPAYTRQTLTAEPDGGVAFASQTDGRRQDESQADDTLTDHHLADFTFDLSPFASALPQGVPTAAQGADESQADTLPIADATANDILRVPLPKVDSLVSLVGELVVQRTGIVDRSDRLDSGVDDLDPILARLRRIAADLDGRFGEAGNLFGPVRASGATRGGAAPEFDALEMDQYGDAYQLSREILELAADLTTTRREIGTLLEDLQDGLIRQGRIVGQIHEQLLDMRLVPIALLNARLQRTVRQAAATSGKEVGFVLEGAQTLVDKTLLEEIADPLLHLLRNAVDHGIEAPDERQRRGKEPAGTIRLTAGREGKEIVVRVQDDGAGIDPDRVFARARERGLVASDAPADAARAHELIFAAGFSTAPTVTGLSGRGIGLDVVRTHIARARGAVTVTSTPGGGTAFTIRVPALLVVTPVLVLDAGGRRVALPITQVRRVLSVEREQLTRVGDTLVFTLDGVATPVRPLAEALGLPYPEIDAWPDDLLLTIVAVGDAQIPLLVDAVIGQHEAVVKTPSAPFDAIHALAGATVLGNGEVLLVLNLLELFSAHVRGAAQVGSASSAELAAPDFADSFPAPEHGRPPTILVVDDSLSVRRVVSRTLTQRGWKVQEARDGLQALAMVRESRPDAMLLDVEMPRMDGFEVTATLRRDAAFHTLPIVMLTSRGGDKHRRKAMDLGVDAYLVKPYQEAVLLETLRRVLRPTLEVVA